MKSSTVDFVIILSKDPWFAEQFPAVRYNLKFDDSQAMLRFLDTSELRLVVLLDERLDIWPGWSKNHLVIRFHDYSTGGGSFYDGGDVAMAFNRDDDAAYALVNGIIEHMLT